jgi:hypothetical protein
MKTIRFVCPGCSQPFETPSSMAGTPMSCPECGRGFVAMSYQPSFEKVSEWKIPHLLLDLLKAFLLMSAGIILINVGLKIEARETLGVNGTAMAYAGMVTFAWGVVRLFWGFRAKLAPVAWRLLIVGGFIVMVVSGIGGIMIGAIIGGFAAVIGAILFLKK